MNANVRQCVAIMACLSLKTEGHRHRLTKYRPSSTSILATPMTGRMMLTSRRHWQKKSSALQMMWYQDVFYTHMTVPCIIHLLLLNLANPVLGTLKSYMAYMWVAVPCSIRYLWGSLRKFWATSRSSQRDNQEGCPSCFEIISTMMQFCRKPERKNQ